MAAGDDEPVGLRSGRKPLPNYTQVPNVVIDYFVPRLAGAEVRVLLFILRMTIGYHRQEVLITLKRIAEGRRTADGKRVEWGCGLTKGAISRALASLESIGLIERREGGREGTTYILNIDEELVIDT